MIEDQILSELQPLKPYIYYRARTGSVYIKFQNKKIGSIRIGDHCGKEKYRYKWNLRRDMKGTREINDRDVIRYFYGFDEVETLISDILKYYSEVC